MLNNREIAILVWLMVCLLWGLSTAPIRKGMTGVVRAALAWKLVTAVLTAFAWMALIVGCLHQLGVWRWANAKVAVLWFLTAALVMIFNVTSADDEHYFRKAILDGARISVVLEFIVNFYVFNLFLEFILVPIITVLSCLLVVAELNEEYKPVRLFLNGFMATFGFGLLIYATHKIYTDFWAFAQLDTLVELLLPLILTVFFLPFLFLLATLMAYEQVFVRLRFMLKDPILQRYTKVRLIRRFGLNFHGINRWWRQFVMDRPSTKEELKASFNRSATND